MYIERLDNDRLLIDINDAELALFDSKSVLSALIPIAAAKAGFSLKNKRLSAQRLPHSGGVFLIVTITERRLLAGGSPPIICARFDSLETVFDCIDRLDRTVLSSAKLCISYRKYTLVAILSRYDDTIFRVLSEYATVSVISRKQALNIEEFADKSLIIP